MFLPETPKRISMGIRFFNSIKGRCDFYYQVSLGKFNCLADFGIKGMWLIFKARMFIDQSKTNLDVKILFGKVTGFV